jgi:hypothetical protein
VWNRPGAVRHRSQGRRKLIVHLRRIGQGRCRCFLSHRVGVRLCCGRTVP